MQGGEADQLQLALLQSLKVLREDTVVSLHSEPKTQTQTNVKNEVSIKTEVTPPVKAVPVVAAAVQSVPLAPAPVPVTPAVSSVSLPVSNSARAPAVSSAGRAATPDVQPVPIAMGLNTFLDNPAAVSVEVNKILF